MWTDHSDIRLIHLADQVISGVWTDQRGWSTWLLVGNVNRAERLILLSDQVISGVRTEQRGLCIWLTRLSMGVWAEQIYNANISNEDINQVKETMCLGRYLYLNISLESIYDDWFVITDIRPNSCSQYNDYVCLISSVRRVFASKLKGAGFKSQQCTLDGPVTIIMWSAQPDWKLVLC